MSTNKTSAAVRATAAALAVFATMVTLNSVVSIAEGQTGSPIAKAPAAIVAAAPSATVVR